MPSTDIDGSPIFILGRPEVQLLQYIFQEFQDLDNGEINLFERINTFLKETGETN